MSPIKCIESKSSVSPALIMIPDISGFTEYIYDADLSHSQMRIASLLEAILDSNELELNVSEIEGDAILFYCMDNTSTYHQIIEQCKLMFTRFHEKLKEFEGSGCQCGSCHKLQKLTLKFILHFGQLGSVMVKDYCKLYGRDLIIAHRLLKNDLPLDEYILFTDMFSSQYLVSNMINDLDGIQLKNTKQSISNIGVVEYYYFNLNPLLNAKR